MSAYKVNFICKLCSSTLQNPHQASCCGKHFCKSCVDKECSATNAESATCPECKATEVTFFQDKHFERLLTLHGERPANLEKDPQDKEKESSFSNINCDNNLPHRIIPAVDHRAPTGERVAERSLIKEHDKSANKLDSQKASIAVEVGAECEHCEGHENVLGPKEKPSSSDQKLMTLSRLSSQLSTLSKEMRKRQDKVEQMLYTQEKMLRSLYMKVEILEKRVSSHTLLPYSVTISNIDSYMEGRVGDEWRSPEFYTGTYSNKSYKLQLSVVPNSLHMRNKEKALSARLLIASGENDRRLNWPFPARFNLVFTNPTGTEKPYVVVGRHTWESPGDESSMQFLACITHKDLLKYVQEDNSLCVCICDY